VLPALVVLAGVFTLRAAASGQAAGGPVPDIQVLKVQGNVYMLAGPGGNTTVQAGETGVIVVDTQTAAVSDKLFAAIRSISPKPIHYIINTNGRSEAVGGNAALAKAGPTRPNRFPVQAGLGGNVEAKTTIIAHETVLNRLIATPGVAPEAWPTETFFGDDTEIFFNNEAIQVLHQPAAQTDGDSIVFFRRSDVIATGDLFTTTGYPVIDAEKGGSINGVIAALNHIIDIAIPDHKVQEGGTMIVPGHGRLCDEQDVIEYRDMVTIVRDRVQYMIGKGRTLDQIKAAKPTLDFDPRYDTSGSRWTAAMFIEQIYRDLTKKK
jgi:glyoxylase-like metal-dependent hydrolase (beta-lactamase superfamily II)